VEAETFEGTPTHDGLPSSRRRCVARGRPLSGRALDGARQTDETANHLLHHRFKQAKKEEKV
jgi:hypothetical protein